jgi:hypothetical protein
MKCNNAGNFDTFGNYREAKVVQIKHHWFWKVCVFSRFDISINILDFPFF